MGVDPSGLDDDSAFSTVDQQSRGKGGRHQTVCNDTEAIGDLREMQIGRFGFVPDDDHVETSSFHASDDRTLRIAAIEGGEDVLGLSVVLDL